MRIDDPLSSTGGRSPGIRLVRMLGVSEFAPQAEECVESAELLQCAHQNGLAYMYLRRLAENGRLDGLRGEYERHMQRHTRLHSAIRPLTEALEATGREYLLLRALRSYPANARDIDLIALGGEDDRQRLARAIRGLGYEERSRSGASTRFRPTRGPTRDLSPDHEPIEVDLYREIGVGGLVIFDKNRLLGQSRLTEFISFADRSQTTARVLPPWLELFLTCLHSLLSKRSYRFDLLYTTVHCIGHSGEGDLHLLAGLCRSVHLERQVGYVLALTSSILKWSLGMTDPRLDGLARMLTRAEPVVPHDLPCPYPTTVLLSTVIRAALTHRKGISSAGTALAGIMDPRRAAKVTRRVLLYPRGGGGSTAREGRS